MIKIYEECIVFPNPIFGYQYLLYHSNFFFLYQDTKITDLEDTVNNLPDLAALEGRVQTVEDAINNLPDTAALEAQIQAVEDTVANLPDTAALEARVQALEDAGGNF